MTTSNTADILFCLDASASMAPCFEAVRRHLGDFVTSLGAGAGQPDLRLDFVAYSAGVSQQSSPQEEACIFRLESLYNRQLCTSLYGSQSAQSGRFFTRDQHEFRQGLSKVTTGGDEAPLVALDCALDFPWRPAASCHRVIIMMTDEPAEDGVILDAQLARLPDLIEKAAKLRVLLHLIAPDSPTFDMLAALDKCEYEPVDAQGDGLASVDFRKVLTYIGKSVSESSRQASSDHAVPRGLYGQATWTSTTEDIRGA